MRVIFWIAAYVFLGYLIYTLAEGAWEEEKMTYTELKVKYGESVINHLVTDIVISGMREAGAGGEGLRTPFGEVIVQCLGDLRASDWNDIRATIKRSL